MWLSFQLFNLLINWRLPMLGFSTSRKGFGLCKSLHQQKPHVMLLLDLMASNTPKMDWWNTSYLNYGHNVTFNFGYTLSWFNDYFVAHKKVNGSTSGGFLCDVYQIWDEVILLTPKKEHLVSHSPICREQTNPAQKLADNLSIMIGNNWDFLSQEICYVIIAVFSSPSSCPPSAWPGTDWGYIPQSRCLAPNGTYWVCGSYLWVGLPFSGIGRWTLSLAFTHDFVFSEFPEKLANLPHLKTCWARSLFHWYDYLAAMFIPSLGSTDVMLWVDVLTNFAEQALQDSQKAISALNAEQMQIRKVVSQNRLAAQGGTCALFIPNVVHIYQIWTLMLLTFLNTWTRWFRR